MKTALYLTNLFLVGGVLLGACTDSEPDLPRLEFSDTMPAELTVGDTTDALTMTRFFANSQGQERSTTGYQGFTFTASDSSVIQVVEKRRLLGLKPGKSDISASDNLGAETRKPATVTVKE